MKVTFSLSIEPRVFPFTYYEQLGRSFYDRAPSYERHDEMSLHSIGWIRGQADATSRGLVFSSSSSWSLGVVHKNVLEEYLRSVDDDPEIMPGMRVDSVSPVQANGGRVRYWAESPILIRREGTHHTFEDDEANEGLTHSLRSKLSAIGFPDDICEAAHAEFDTTYSKARTKVVHIGKAKYRANVCPIIIEAEDPLIHEMAMSAGLGGLTGMGLGAILPSNSQ
jgi:CRISPR-associated endoribonuclease Cas6